MPEQIHPSLAPTSEKIKALQYIFDVARTGPAPAPVHEQVKAYAQFLADSFNPVPEPVKEVPKPATVAEAVAEATSRQGEESPTAAPVDL